jgi:hypothetical protein
MVLGILILSNIFTGYFFRNNDMLRYSFGALIILYGLFRAYSAYTKLKRGNKDEEENRYRL